MEPRIVKIQIPGLNINARCWGPNDGKPILALHGWLDNAATFDLIAPLMPEFQIVAIDFPGHGFSDHLPECVAYNNVDRTIQMFQIADSLGWNRFSVIGHSLGGIVAQIMAATMPDRIDKVVLIDVFGSYSKPTSTFTSQLRSYIINYNKKIPHTKYRTIQEAIIHRAEINPQRQLSEEGAAILAKGGLQFYDGYYSWTYDIRLQIPYSVLLTDEQVNVIMDSFTSDCLLIIASQGIVKINDEQLVKVKLQKNTHFVELEGKHHLHLDTPIPVAKLINDFFQ